MASPYPLCLSYYHYPDLMRSRPSLADALRSVPSEFNEGKYIGFALANNMQTTLIALLLLFMTSDNPTLFFVMRWIAVFVVAVLT